MLCFVGSAQLTVFWKILFLVGYKGVWSLAHSSKFFNELLKDPNFDSCFELILIDGGVPKPEDLYWCTDKWLQVYRFMSLLFDPKGPCDQCGRMGICEVDFTWDVRVCKGCWKAMWVPLLKFLLST